MPPPLLSLALVAFILSACSSSLSGFIAASATFALVYLSPSCPRKSVSFSDQRNKMYHIDTSDPISDDDMLPPTSPIEDVLAHVHPLWSSDDLLGRLTSIEEEDDETEVDTKPYSISVQDYVPVAAMSLPPVGFDPSALEDDVFEAAREDQQDLIGNLGVSQSAPGVPASGQPTPLAAVVATFAAATVSAAAQVATSAAQEVATAAAQASAPKEAAVREEATLEQTSSEGSFSLADLSAALHRDILVERVRARRSFVQPSDHLYNRAYRAQLRREAASALAAGSSMDLTRRLSGPVPCVPSLLVSPPSESESPVPPNTPVSAATTTTTTLCGASQADSRDDDEESLEDLQPLQQDDAELSTSNVDLFHLPLSRVEGHMDRRLSLFSSASLPTRRVAPISHPRSRIASDPLPIRSTSEEDVPVSSTESLADARAPYDGGVGLRTSLSPRRVGQRILPIHRPLASALASPFLSSSDLGGTALQSDAVAPNQRPMPLVHKRSFSDSHFNYVRARHPDYVASLDSPPRPRCSTPPCGDRRSKAHSAPTSGRSIVGSHSGSRIGSESESVRSASALGSTTAQPSFSATLLSTPLGELENQINSALSDKSFDESLRLAGYSWRIGTIPFLTRRSASSEGAPASAEAEAEAEGEAPGSGFDSDVPHRSAFGSQVFSDSPPHSPSASAPPSATSSYLAPHPGSRCPLRPGSGSSSSGSGSSTSTSRPPRSALFNEVLGCLGLPLEGTVVAGRLQERQRTLTPGVQLRDQPESAAEEEQAHQQDAALPPSEPCTALEQPAPPFLGNSSSSSSSSSPMHVDKQKQKEGLALFSLSLPREGKSTLVTTPLPPPPAAGRAAKAVVVSVSVSGLGSGRGKGKGKDAGSEEGQDKEKGEEDSADSSSGAAQLK